MILLVFDFVILGSRRFKDRANEIGKKIIEKGYRVKLINEAAPRIKSQGIAVVKNLKTQYQREHFDAIRQCKNGVVLCNFGGYIGLNTKAELIFANAFEKPIFSIESVNSKEEELIIMNIKKFDLNIL